MPDQSQPLRSRRPEILFGFLVFLSGMAALGHQLLWTRRLIDLLGASGESSARVFGTFFLGLSVGSAIAALVVGRIRNPLRFAGWVQLSIPVLIIPVIYLSGLTDWIWPTLGAQSVHGSNGYAIKSFLTLSIVLPPSAMMGLSFPLIVAGVLRLNRGRLGRSGIHLYAINTLGGASGVLFTVMIALPELGNFASMILAGFVDGMVGVALLLYSRSCDFSQPLRGELASSVERGTGKPFVGAIGLAFFSGMAVLALEVTALQMFQLVATISLFSPAAVLFCAIASLGLSAAIFSRFESTLMSAIRGRAIVLILAASGILVVLAPQIFMGIARRSNWFASNEGVSEFVFELGALALLSVGPAWLVAGLIFPFAVASAGEHCSSIQSGRRLGVLLAVNGIGGLLGAELAYRVLLPTCGVYGAMAVIAAGLAMTAIVVSLFSQRVTLKYGNRVLAGASVFVVLMMAPINANLPVVNPPPGVRAIDIQSGREGTVAVIEDQRGERSILVANQYLLGGTSVRYDQERQALLPILLHKMPVSVGCIGLATGITPGAALAIPAVNEVTSIEISPLVAKAAEVYFSEFNHNICRDETATVVIGDGRTYIASLTNRFDVITGDLFLPWEPGTSRLYSREHFASVRRALKSDGIFCQWLPMYQLTPEQFRLIADTFADAFGETHLFINHFRVSAPMLALVGGKDSRGCLNWDLVGRQCDRFRETDAVRDPLLRHKSGVRLLYLGEWQTDENETKLVSLADPSLEYSAATVRLSQEPGKSYFNRAIWTGFCRDRQQLLIDDLDSNTSSPADRMMLATRLLELDDACRTQPELARSVASQVAEAIPRCIVDDRMADWDRWPGNLSRRVIFSRRFPNP